MRILLVVSLLVGGLIPTPLHLEPGSAWILYDGDVEGAVARAERHGLQVYRLDHLDMAIVGASPASVATLQALYGVQAKREWYEQLHLDRSVPFIEVPPVWQSVGSAREGPTVLVVDTGVSSLHPDFDENNLVVNIGTEFVGGVLDAIQQDGPVFDPSGHGTHVAGIVAGSGAGLGQAARSGPYQGVYSNGRIASFQAAVEDQGDILVSGQAILAAYDWALENQARYDIRVISNSWGSPGDLDINDPIERATLKMYLKGMTIVFSAGNEGKPNTLNRHCTAPWVLCVAGGDLDGRVDSYSSRGNTHEPYSHPDITAPGTQIRAPAPLESTEAEGLLSGRGEALYSDRTGTSMAAPHVAGVAALILALNPALSPDQVMDILVGSSRIMAEPVEEAGGGYLVATSAATLASQTTGNLPKFLSGKAVKYAGALTGDPVNAVDPVTAGIDFEGRPTLLAASGPLFQEDYFLPVVGGAAGLFAVALLLGIIMARR